MFPDQQSKIINYMQDMDELINAEIDRIDKSNELDDVKKKILIPKGKGILLRPEIDVLRDNEKKIRQYIDNLNAPKKGKGQFGKGDYKEVAENSIAEKEKAFSELKAETRENGDVEKNI